MDRDLIYLVWAIRNNKCICDGMTSTMNPLDIVQTILIIGGIAGLLGGIWYKFTGSKRWF